MKAMGTFDVALRPQADERFPAGRMTIDKTYFGDVAGTGKGQMVSKRTEAGASVYFAIEEFKGTVGGKKGTFTLVHKGLMSKEFQTLDVSILDGSGSGELENIAGDLLITQDDDGHAYELSYES